VAHALPPEAAVRQQKQKERRMRIQGQVLIGIIIVIAGLLLGLALLLDIDVGAVCFPIGLIGLGILLLLRPYLLAPDTAFRFRAFGPIRRGGDWPVAPEEIWLLVGDVKLDLSEATVPPGETLIRTFAFVSNIRLTVPADLALSIGSQAFVTDGRVFGQKSERILQPYRVATEGYDASECRIRLENMSFVADIRTREA
jgi:hypothetical protein